MLPRYQRTSAIDGGPVEIIDNQHQDLLRQTRRSPALGRRSLLGARSPDHVSRLTIRDTATMNTDRAAFFVRRSFRWAAYAEPSRPGGMRALADYAPGE